MNNSIDLTIIAIYLTFIVSLGVWVAIRNLNRSHDSARNYFLASSDDHITFTSMVGLTRADGYHLAPAGLVSPEAQS